MVRMAFGDFQELTDEDHKFCYFGPLNDVMPEKRISTLKPGPHFHCHFNNKITVKSRKEEPSFQEITWLSALFGVILPFKDKAHIQKS